MDKFVYHIKVDNSEELNQKLLGMIDEIPCSELTYNLGVSKFDGHNHPDVWKVPLKWKWFDVQCLPGVLDQNGKVIHSELSKYTSPHENIPHHCDYKGFFLDGVESELRAFANNQIKPDITKLDYRFDIRGMWFHQMQQNDYMEWDNHFFAQWACVYYVELPDPEMATEFIHPQTNEVFQPEGATSGDMVIFPTFMLHRSPLITDTRRKTVIAWNMDVACLYEPQYFDRLADTHPDNWDRKYNNFSYD